MDAERCPSLRRHWPMSHSASFISPGLASAFVQGGTLVRTCKRSADVSYNTTFSVPHVNACKKDTPRSDNTSGSWFSGLGDAFWGRKSENGSKNVPPSSKPDPPPAVDLTTVEVPVISILPVSSAGNVLQITVNVAGTGLSSAHVSPGQFVQIALMHKNKRGKAAAPFFRFVTIATPPGSAKEVFDFLIDTKLVEYNFRNLKENDNLRISPVIGRGLDYEPAASSSNVLIFVDNEQGLAAVRSFVEFERFRAASGNGAMRRTSTTVFYSVPNHKAMAYAKRFSKWLVFGVNVVPILGLSLLEYLSQRNISGDTGHLREHYALLCVSSNATFEALRNYTMMLGLPTTRLQHLTHTTMAEDVYSFDNDDSWRPPPPKANSSGASRFEEMRRKKAEQDSWARWVKIRNSMKQEFERKWAARARSQRDSERATQEKEQAWASWFGRNYEKWNQSTWDNESWAGYRDFWVKDRDNWSGQKNWSRNASSGPAGSSRKYGEGGYGWQQQNSQEYWDWVGKGTESQGSASGSTSSSGSNDWYDKHRDSGGAWGSSSSSSSYGYKERGYRYQWEDESSNGNSGSSWYQNNSGRSQGKNANDNSSRNSWGSSSSRGSNPWNSSGAKSSDLDLYAVLGLSSSASKSEIKRAYRKKAMEHHPDRNPEQSDIAHMKMKEIVAAYTVLKDETKRKKYDSFGSSGF